MFSRVRSLATLLVAFAIAATAQTPYQQRQSRPVKMGTSGGNVNDITKRYCCSGTLGALVTKGGQQYVLSNNHVLNISGSGTPGDDISQPGLIDAGCRVGASDIVADLTQAAPLGSSNVDAAIALARTGQVDTSGAILSIGVPSSTAAVPSVGRGVAKAGRTTGFTCSTIGSINTDVNVQYQASCGQGKKFVVSYQDQVVMNSATFSAGGDSGSLIVTTDTAQPVALLFAGSSTTTIGNPIQDVMSALGVSFVGGGNHAVSCSGASSTQAGVEDRRGNLGNSEIARAKTVKDRNKNDLFRDEAVMGVGVGEAEDNPGEAVLVVYIEQGRGHNRVPASIDGVRTKVVYTDEFKAYGWNEKLMPEGSCKK